MSWLRKKRVLLALFVAMLALLFINSSWMGRLMYPIRYTEDIKVSAVNNDVDPYLLAAVIRTETNFRTGQVSSKGALGIMQIMPDTARWIVERAEFSDVSMDDIRDRADIGIELGAWYLHSLHVQFDDNPVAAVAAYNAGPGNVRSWLNTGVWDGRSETSDSIPFGETRNYVQRVIYYYNKYKAIYPTL